MKAPAGKVAVLIEEQYQELEVWVPYYRLREAGRAALLVGQEKGKVYKGKYGYPAQAEASYADVRAEGLDGVVIPGGFAPDFMRRYPEPARLVREIFEAGNLVAAICHAGWMLASAGVLKGKKATSFFAIKDDVTNAGATWVDQEVVVEGNLITSRKPDNIPAFCREIVKALGKS